MTDKELIDRLKVLASLHGTASVAVSLNYKNQRTIDRWLKEGRVPEFRRPAVINYLRKEVANGNVLEKKKVKHGKPRKTS